MEIELARLAQQASEICSLLVFDQKGKLLDRFENLLLAVEVLQVNILHVWKHIHSKPSERSLLKSLDGKLYRFEFERTLNPESSERVGSSWKRCQGYLRYEVSDFGQIRDGRTHRIIREELAPSGYMCVRLFEYGLPPMVLVHDLVACTWLGAPSEDKSQVRHKKGKKNNSVANLEWVPASEDQWNYSTATKRDYPYRVAVEQLDDSGRLLGRFPSMKEAARALHLHESGIRSVVHGKKKSCGGFNWRRATRETTSV